jgi:hypothetical protein
VGGWGSLAERVTVVAQPQLDVVMSGGVALLLYRNDQFKFADESV